jgi:hypothetical protein
MRDAGCLFPEFLPTVGKASKNLIRRPRGPIGIGIARGFGFCGNLGPLASLLGSSTTAPCRRASATIWRHTRNFCRGSARSPPFSKFFYRIAFGRYACRRLTRFGPIIATHKLKGSEQRNHDHTFSHREVPSNQLESDFERQKPQP